MEQGRTQGDGRAGLRLLGYWMAAGAVLLATGLGMALQRFLSVTADAPFFAAVALASWYGGLGPGMVATFGSALAVDYFFVPPLYAIRFDSDHIVRLITFSVVSLLISWMNHLLQRERERAEQRESDARHELEERQRVETERVALLTRERDARRQAEAAQRRLAFLAEAGRLVASSLEMEATLASIGRLVVPLVSDWCFMYLVQPDGSMRRAGVASPPEQEPIARELLAEPLGAGFSRTPVARRVLIGEHMLFAEVNDDVLRGMAENDEHLERIRRLGATSMMIVPLQVHRRVFGAMVLVAISSGRRFTEQDLDVAEEVAGRAAAALANAQLYQETQDANRMKDEFLATVSHELRTPLHAILGWSRLLRGGKLDADASARAVETIERNAHAQAQLVADILDVSRIVTGKLKLDMRPVAVVTAVESTLDAVRPTAHAKGIELAASAGDPRLTVLADPGRLQQILWNLLTNAIKFTPAGGRVEVESRRAGGDAEIRVSDSGIGIDKAFLPFVFDRFRQADSSTSRAHGGLGLGLAIVRHLAEAHGGRVGVESDGRGSGATFTVHLPALVATRPATRGEAASHVPEGALAGLRVLAVDDQADARELVATSLQRYGATVRTAASAREALDMVTAERPDVLIGDIGMPGEDGYALIRDLRARPAQQGGRLPAIALTAYARTDDRARALEAGFQVHLSKPIDDAELAAAVAALAGRDPQIHGK